MAAFVHLPQVIDTEENFWCKQEAGEIDVLPSESIWSPVFNCGPVPDYPPLRIVINWEWKYVGRGEEDGNLMFRISRNGRIIAKTIMCEHPPEREWQRQQIIFEDDSLMELFEDCAHQDTFEVWGAPGEEEEAKLVVRNFAMCIEGRHDLSHVVDEHPEQEASLILDESDPITGIYQLQRSVDGNDVWFRQSNSIHLVGDYNDTWRQLFQCGTIFDHAPEKITFDFDWKDQGWGNQKGLLQLRFVRRGTEVGSFDITPSTAPHDWEHTCVELVGLPLLQLLVNAQPGDEIEIWRFVGNGGGHELFVKNFALGLVGKLTSKSTAPVEPIKITSDLHLQLARLPVDGQPVVYVNNDEHNLSCAAGEDQAEWRRIFKSLPLRFSVVNVALVFDWKQSEYVNQRFIVKLTRAGRVVATSTVLDSFAIEDWSRVELGLPAASAVMMNHQQGDCIELWRFVGEGFGTGLSVRNIEFTLTPSQASN